MIAPADQPPILEQPVDRSILEGESIQISLVASDPDGSGNPLKFSSNFLQGGASLDPKTCVFDWTQGYDEPGVYQVPFTVSDGTLSTTDTTTITVLDVNAPPQFDYLGAFQRGRGPRPLFPRVARWTPTIRTSFPRTATANGTLTPLDGTDPTVTYTVSGLPSGATFDPATDLFSWTPGYDTIDGADAAPEYHRRTAHGDLRRQLHGHEIRQRRAL